LTALYQIASAQSSAASRPPWTTNDRTPATSADACFARAIRDFAELWRVAEKVVYSRTLQTVTSARTRIEREFDPVPVRRLKETSVSDITVRCAELAGQAISAGLVDECHLFLNPILVGGGKRACPTGCALAFSSWMSTDSGAASGRQQESARRG
jgi:dihydrofolate reductase